MTATVLQLSDTHFTDRPDGRVSGEDPRARLETVLAAWVKRGLHADLVVLTGDNADDASTAAYGRLAEAIRPMDAPVLAMAGNHDEPAGVAEAFGPATSAEVGAWRVVALDSSRPGQVHGTVDVGAALAALDALDDRPTIVGIHHPPRSRSTNAWFRLDGAEELLAGLAARPHVRALISGHLHDPFELIGPEGLALLGGPSTLAPIEHDGDTYEVGRGGPTGARALFLDEDGTFTSTVVAA